MTTKAYSKDYLDLFDSNKVLNISSILRKIGERKPCGHKSVYHGLCDSVWDLSFDLQHAVYFERWEKFSGDCEYPVPHPKKDSEKAYEEAVDTGSMYKGQYGRDRRELALWCADQLDMYLEDTNEQ